MPHSKAESLLFGLATFSKDKGGIVVRDFEGIYLLEGNPPILTRSMSWEPETHG